MWAQQRRTDAPVAKQAHIETSMTPRSRRTTALQARDKTKQVTIKASSRIHVRESGEATVRTGQTGQTGQTTN